ncbi:uncharacterized protein F4822DRAFT_383988 [Hypoxylon trugodes]|uniref:uncharacterized protein n=1 Tax=Hypoxylon trugodes TaxID=326681 RepID=UPI00219277A1|nr:uncharacterized protein F4822DRAFT_383988 [Hypoxylon trugodes]KAI1393225.1 hypothetical protein F4822DRAFT_383988 [Hypoxylon trugodes]
MNSSPTKRRALAPMDANSRTPSTTSKLQTSKPKPQVLSTSPIRSDHSATKRLLNQESSHDQHPSIQPFKKRRVSIDEDVQSTPVGDDPVIEDSSHENEIRSYDILRQRSDSPDEESSLFDNSAIDATQDTTITEPDVEVLARVPPVQAPAPGRQRAISREEARRKAETLRLRLGLASYKVRTGQTDVPLDQLKVKPLPGNNTRGRSGWYEEQPSLPPLPRITYTREESEEREQDEEERHSRPRTATQKPVYTESFFGQENSFDEAYQISELPMPSSETMRGSPGKELANSGLSGIAARVLMSTSQS